MPVEVIFPRVDMDMAAGRITQWFVTDGGRIAKGAPLFEIETDKAAMEIEAPADGLVRLVRGELGVEIAVGSPVAWIFAEGEDPGVSPPAPVTPPPASAHIALAADVEAATVEPTPQLLRATPLARSLAAQARLDLARIVGSGPRGRIIAADVEAKRVQPLTEIAGGTLHCLRFGAEHGVPIVLLHGFGADASTWRPVWSALERAHPVLVIDLPGHGKSAGLATPTIEALAGAVRETVQAQGIERLHLVGHSLGGAVALTLADADPALVRSLCLLAPAGMGPEINGAFLSGFIRATREDSLAPWLRLLFHDPARVTSGFVGATLRDRPDLGALAQALFPDGTQALDLRRLLQAIDVPAKVIWGMSDRIIPPSHARALPAPVAVHLLSGVGHMPHAEAPELCARLIAELARAGV